MSKISKLKNEATIIVICVIALTTTTLGMSYAIFFDIGTGTSNQTITTGTLNVEFGSSSSSIVNYNMVPVTDEVGLASEAQSVVYLQNTGSLDTVYDLNIGYDLEEYNNFLTTNPNAKLIPIEYIKIALFEYNNDTMQMELVSDIMTMGDLLVSNTSTLDEDTAFYNIYSSSIEKMSSGNNAKTYAVKIWLDEFSSEEIINYSLFLKFEVVSTIKESLQDYNINANLLNSDGSNLIGATISIDNGSQTKISDENGLFILNNMRQDTYKINVNKDNINYVCTFSFKESNENKIGNYLTNHVVTEGQSIQSIANTYSTTVKLIREKNNMKFLSSIHNDVLLSYSPLLLPNTQEIVAGSNTELNMNLTLQDDGSCKWEYK